MFNTLEASVIEYGLGLLTLSKAQHDLLEIKMKACGQSKGAPEAMRHVLDLPTAAERHRLAYKEAHTSRWQPTLSIICMKRLGGSKR